MSLNGALQIGRSALIASQTGIQVAGNNMANAATEGYSRRLVELNPMRGEPLGRGQFIGRGVEVDVIRRAVDAALQSRHRDALSQENASLIDQRFLTSIESLQNELSDNDISSLLSTFFNSFSELANNPEDLAVRSVVIEEGRNIASRLATLRGEYQVVRGEVDQSLDAAVGRVNELLDEITLINRQVAETEAGVGQENALRDQRDLLVDELSQLMDVSVIEQPNGAFDVLVGSIPVVLGGESRGVELRTEPLGDTTEVSVRVAADGTTLNIESGQIGGLLRQRGGTVDEAIESLDTFATELIFQVNRVHAQGQGQAGVASVSGTEAIGDPTANLNASAVGLNHRIEGGSFFIHVTHTGSGVRTAHQINVDGDAMSLNDLIAQINGNVPNATASAGLGNRLQLDAASGYELSFSDDSGGAMAALGVNTFFTGENAGDIDVNQVLLDDPSRLAAGAGHVAGSNGTALAIANLQDEPVDELNGSSLREFWQNAVNTTAVRTNAVRGAADSARLVRESLSAQLQAVSGVSLDEEAISLLTFQRQFQAAARFISVIDETFQTLLSIA